MKRLVFLLLGAALLLTCAGCGSGKAAAEVKSGCFYLVGDHEEFLTPYIHLNTEDQVFQLGAGAVISYAEIGEYEIQGSKLIAVSQSDTYVFEIRDENTLVLENGWEFRYNEDMK